MDIELIKSSVTRLKEFAPVIFGLAGTCGIDPPKNLGETKQEAYLAGYLKALETVEMLFKEEEPTAFQRAWNIYRNGLGYR